MEPGVADVVCQQAAAAAAARDPRHQHQSSTQHSAGQASSRQGTSQLDGLSGLVQQHMSVQQFLTSYWETQPVLLPKSAAKQLLHATQRAGAPAAQPLPTGDPVTATSQGSAAEELAVQLTPWGFLSELVPRAQHCPVLPAAMDDPVQVGSLCPNVAVCLGGGHECVAHPSLYWPCASCSVHASVSVHMWRYASPALSCSPCAPLLLRFAGAAGLAHTATAPAAPSAIHRPTGHQDAAGSAYRLPRGRP